MAMVVSRCGNSTGGMTVSAVFGDEQIRQIAECMLMSFDTRCKAFHTMSELNRPPAPCFIFANFHSNLSTWSTVSYVLEYRFAWCKYTDFCELFFIAQSS